MKAVEHLANRKSRHANLAKIRNERYPINQGNKSNKHRIEANSKSSVCRKSNTRRQSSSESEFHSDTDLNTADTVDRTDEIKEENSEKKKLKCNICGNRYSGNCNTCYHTISVPRKEKKYKGHKSESSLATKKRSQTNIDHVHLKFLQTRLPGRPKKGTNLTDTTQCPECDKVFARPDVLHLHFRSVHLNERFA
ncbi:hypothetical protein B4U80_12025, partial [Leptotrombidium deliense]